MRRRILLGFVFGFVACAEPGPPRPDGGRDGATVIDCPVPPPDSDKDGISDVEEGAGPGVPIPRDSDADGTPDYLDLDSDGDGILDSIEGGNANPCSPTLDSDFDGKQDFRDRDSDDREDGTVNDTEEAGADLDNPRDTDSDGIPDYADDDSDGDGISDVAELTPPFVAAPQKTLATAPDSDGDGTPDFLDRDSDDDLIRDEHEGGVDTDGDGLHNFRDKDSDNDCVPDQAEAGDDNPNTPPIDSDLDGNADYLDRDTDADGLSDDKEDKNCDGKVDPCETDRLAVDTDGDGVNDLVEQQGCAVKTPAQQLQLMCACDGSNASKSPLSRGDFVFIVDYMKPPAPMQSTLDLSTAVKQSDVVFTMDTTGSMGPCAVNLATNLASQVVPSVISAVPDTAFGVVEFRDFSLSPVVAYRHRIQTVKTPAGLMAVQAALMALGSQGGGDEPEAGWEALYSIAGGPARSGSNVGSWASVFDLPNIPPTVPTPGEKQGSLYGAAFRVGSVPIVVAVADTEFHDKPGITTSGEDGLWNYGAGTDCPTGCGNVPSRAETVARLNVVGAHVIGLAVAGAAGYDPKTRLRALAQETGAVVLPSDFGSVRPTGCAPGDCCTGLDGVGEPPVGGKCPLSFSIPRAGSFCPVSSAIVSGITTLTTGLAFDLHVEASDVDPNTVDNFVQRLVPNLSGLGPAMVCITVPPSPLRDDYTGPKAAPGADGTLDTFPGVSGDRRVCFDVVPKTNTTVMRMDEPQVFRAQLQVKGVGAGGSINLGVPREVFFLVPPKIENGPVQ
jgi:hypothetical protein